jgi:hypothetical protein
MTRLSRLCLLLVLLLLPQHAFALTTYYLDPDVAGGTHVGTQANPFQTFTAGTWTTINTALASGDVTVYCSARAASSDTDQAYTGNITIYSKTPNPTGTLTIDGGSFYNSDDATPNWVAYSGTSRCAVTGQINSQDGAALTKYNNWILNKMKLIATAAKGLSICGDNVIIQNSDISSAVSNTGTPLILIVPVSDAIHEGSSAPCPAMLAPTLQDNVIHDSAGELIYGGNGGCRYTDTNGFDAVVTSATFDIARSGGTYTPTLVTAGSGYVVNEKLFVLGATLGGSSGSCCGTTPTVNDLLITITAVDGSGAITTFSSTGTSTGSGTTSGVAPTRNCMGMSAGHTNLTIQRNTISKCGSRASQGDCLDMKGGWRHVIIRQNDFTNDLNDNNYRMIVSQGAPNDGTDQDFLIDRNNIHDAVGVDDAAIALVNTWGTPNGITIRNTIIDTITSGNCIQFYATQAAPGALLYNNTLYNCSGSAISATSSTITAENNAVVSNNAGGTQTAMSGTITADHNAWGGSAFGGTCTTCQTGLSATAGVDFTDAPNADFRTVSTSTVLVDHGLTIGSFSNDYAGSTRTGTWDLGAYESGAAGSAPSATPSRFHIRLRPGDED